ncbi:LysR family transcriptional regulator [Pseudomonas sp. FME51]|uniref:LysR family transcriptional regulator n=1 Tax=Pseudomonas sp. FME51 TaxID=2742609 RepID=UPI001866B1AE|nr:LysR family transcriptional regulator [Pseudomonas sp. FME51]
MNLRHLRCFLALAEELNFARAAKRLHIEPSPLSRTIKELELELGVVLFKRDRRGTSLTHPGKIFLDEVRNVFTALDNARQNVQAAALGYQSTLRIALSDGAAIPNLAEILACCRARSPDIEIRVTEVPFSDQLRGLRSNIFDLGFSCSTSIEDSVIAKPVWYDSLMVIMPVRHPLLIHKKIPLKELLHYPLVMCHPEACSGYNWQVSQILRNAGVKPIVAEHVKSMGMLLTLVAAGYGLGFVPFSYLKVLSHPQLVVRKLDVEHSVLTTYLLKPDMVDSPQLEAFVECLLDVVNQV